MKKFGRVRRLEDIKRLAEESVKTQARTYFHINDDAYNEGSDFISILISCKGSEELKYANVSTFNGQFVAYDWASNERIATHLNEDLDEVPWYSDLLDLIYRPAPAGSGIARVEGVVG